MKDLTFEEAELILLPQEEEKVDTPFRKCVDNRMSFIINAAPNEDFEMMDKSFSSISNIKLNQSEFQFE